MATLPLGNTVAIDFIYTKSSGIDVVKKLVVSESNRKSDGIQHHFRPAVAGDRASLRQFADSDMPLHSSSSTTLP